MTLPIAFHVAEFILRNGNACLLQEVVNDNGSLLNFGSENYGRGGNISSLVRNSVKRHEAGDRKTWLSRSCCK